MKFVLVILAIVACGSASILPLGQSLSVSQPLLAAHGWAAPAAAWAPSAWAASAAWAPSAAWASPAAAWAAPAAAWAAPAAAWAAPAAAWAVPAEGQYLAANRGSVHVAPLPGHTQSASSLNLQPAPGTW